MCNQQLKNEILKYGSVNICKVQAVLISPWFQLFSCFKVVVGNEGIKIKEEREIYFIQANISIAKGSGYSQITQLKEGIKRRKRQTQKHVSESKAQLGNN